MSILDWSLKETQYAVVAVKTTGLTHGYDRICEISVVQAVPGQPIRLVLDSVVNPQRKLAGSEIHGIYELSITPGTPVFAEVALDLLRELQGRVLVGHSLKFPLQFLRAEYAALGVDLQTPYIDTMSLASMLTKKPNRPLVDAADQFGIEVELDPTSSAAALGTAHLFRHLLKKLGDMRLKTFKHIQGKKSRAFQRSLDIEPMLKGYAYDLKESVARVSRRERGVEGVPDVALGLYWDALLVALDDMVITDAEQRYLIGLQNDLDLDLDDVYMLHARVFSGVLVAMIEKGTCTEDDRVQMQSLHDCLARLGWSPGSLSTADDDPTTSG